MVIEQEFPRFERITLKLKVLTGYNAVMDTIRVTRNVIDCAFVCFHYCSMAKTAVALSIKEVVLENTGNCSGRLRHNAQ